MFLNSIVVNQSKCQGVKTDNISAGNDIISVYVLTVVLKNIDIQKIRKLSKIR